MFQHVRAACVVAVATLGCSVMVGGLTAAPALASTASCSSTQSSDTDPIGDATQIGAPADVSTPTSEGDLDIVRYSVALTTTANGNAVKFVVKLKDLKPTPPTDSTGELIQFDFTYAGNPLAMVMQRTAEPTGSVKTSFELDDESVSEFNNGPIRTGLFGQFNPTNNEVAALLPADALVAPLGAGVLATGSELDDVQIVAQRQIATAALTADDAISACPLYVG